MLNTSNEIVALRTIEDIDELIELSKYIDYKGRFSKKKIKKSRKILESWKQHIKETGSIENYDI